MRSDRVGVRASTLAGLAGLAALTALVGFASVADAAALLVPRTHRTIQAALDAAEPGDTVFVAPGKYAGPFLIRRSIVLYSTQGADTTILDGGGTVRVIDVEGTSGGAVVGFTIRNGLVSGAVPGPARTT